LQINEHPLLNFLDVAEAILMTNQGNFRRSYELLATARQTAQANGSDYELNLARLEIGFTKIREEKPAETLAELEPTVEYFENEGQRVEAAKSHLCLAVAYFENGDWKSSETQLTQAFTRLPNDDSRNPLITTALRMKKHITLLAAEYGPKSAVGDFVHQLHRFEHRLPTLRKHLRQRASIVPFAMPKMVIRTMGRLQVRLNDHIVSSSDWQTQTARDLFFLLLAHPEGFAKEEIGMIFWPDASETEVKFRFKNTIYRVRHALGKEAVILQDDYYRFNHALDYEYDVEQLTLAMTQGTDALDDKQKIDFYQVVLKLYKGVYLPGIDETWVLPERERLAHMYENALLYLADLNLKNGQLSTALDHCQRVLMEDSCLEAAHRLAMRIHAQMGNRAALARQYERCRQSLEDEIGAQPSPQTQALYESLIK
jgi:LuxR family transcriptional regulator, maltose regulon positive regulatory protein